MGDSKRDTVHALSAGDIVHARWHRSTGRYDYIVQCTLQQRTTPVDTSVLHVVIDIVPNVVFRVRERGPARSCDQHDHTGEQRNATSSYDDRVVIIVMSASGCMHAFVSDRATGEMLTWFRRIGSDA